MVTSPNGNQTFIIGNQASAEPGFFGKAISGIGKITKVVLVAAVVYAGVTAFAPGFFELPVVSEISAVVSNVASSMWGALTEGINTVLSYLNIAPLGAAETQTAAKGLGTIAATGAGLATAKTVFAAKGAAVLGGAIAAAPDVIGGSGLLAQQQQASLATDQNVVNHSALQAIDPNAAHVVQKHTALQHNTLGDVPDTSIAEANHVHDNKLGSNAQKIANHHAEHEHGHTERRNTSHREKLAARSSASSSPEAIQAKMNAWKAQQSGQPANAKNGNFAKRINEERDALASAETSVV